LGDFVDGVRRRFAFRWLIGGCYLAVLAGTLAALGTAVYVQMDRDLRRNGEAQLRRHIEARWNRNPLTRLPTGAARLPAAPGFPDWAPGVARELATADVFVRVLAPDGNAVAEAGGPGGAPPVDAARLLALRRTLEARQRGDAAYVTRADPARSSGDQPPERWQVLDLPLFEGPRLVGFVEAATSRRAADELLAAQLRYLLLGGALALAAGAGAGIALARLLTRPLERLALAAHDVAAGNLDARTGLRQGRNEVYAVAEAFDAMVGRVQASFAAHQRFVADASHELKTPLTAVGGLAELLRSGVAGALPDAHYRLLNTIEREINRMSAIVGDLLALSRAEQRPPLDQCQVDLAALVAEATAHARLVHSEHVVESSIDLPTSTLGDREQLTRVIRNLVDNAAKYTPAGGTLRLSCRADGAWAEVVVADTGSGIPEGALPHVFDRFYRADASRARQTGGSGLGLAIVKSIVEWHRGTVHVSSELGQGTSVTVRLPLAG
jgi:two-component system OmpR family sensor kinase